MPYVPKEKRAAPFGPAMFVSAQEIAAVLACSPKHVHTLTKRGFLPKPVKIGSLARWPKQIIERWLEIHS